MDCVPGKSRSDGNALLKEGVAVSVNEGSIVSNSWEPWAKRTISFRAISV